MAKIVLTNALVIVNGVTLTSNAKKVTVNMSSEVQDATVFGSLTKVNLLGIKDWSYDIEFLQDYAATALHSQLFALWNGQTSFAVEIRADAGARSTSNPALVVASACLPSYSPISGGVGDLAMVSVTFVPGSGVTTMTNLTA